MLIVFGSEEGVPMWFCLRTGRFAGIVGRERCKSEHDVADDRSDVNKVGHEHTHQRG